MKYEKQMLDDNHQLACAMRKDRGPVVWFLNLIYAIHNQIIAAVIRGG